MKISVIGSGISGLMAAYVLSQQHEVDIFEKEAYAGGHAHTHRVPTADGDISVDTGFIVYNELNYPLFTRLLNELRVATIPSDMSFGMQCPETGVAYSSRGLRGLLASPRNALRPDFYRMVGDIVRFNKLAHTALDTGAAKGMTLQHFLEAGRFSQAFVRYYLSPMSSAIWSAAPGATLDFPAEVFFRFFKNHGLLSLSPDIPWRTVKGGSHSYVSAMTATYKERIHLNTPVRAVHREQNQVRLSFDNGPDRLYDRVIIAAHADQALSMLQNPTHAEKRLLHHFPYQSNRTVLHNDASLLPRQTRAWASWNVQAPKRTAETRALTMSYHMNRLQSLRGSETLLVTLNPDASWLDQISAHANGRRIYMDTIYEHPAFGAGSFDVQPELALLNEQSNVSFCGAYFGYGFHEDGVRSGLQAARALGGEWNP